ncbi:tRNA-binding protein [Fulvivirga kasyanovii]|uniref:tRNA-binding protein n=1 Tax=Fulvivirga kasyanovii TaxID=396812 RepID=A0ABW9RXR7_9BACT|nr:tRNA-binding protein [Fulvivirga kasyanovii]MTI29018.1 tRNA-binding protein [Fulvivirga kasyanovii]
MDQINWNDFEKVQLRVGTIVKVEDFPEARKPAYKVWVDLGEDIGIKKSSAQITHHYTKEMLHNKQVVCVVNFPEKQIGPFLSQILITGFADENGHILLAVPDRDVPNGAKLH